MKQKTGTFWAELARPNNADAVSARILAFKAGIAGFLSHKSWLEVIFPQIPVVGPVFLNGLVLAPLIGVGQDHIPIIRTEREIG